MKSKLFVTGLLAILGSKATWAQSESITDVGLQKAQKEAIVKYLQKRVRDHAKMSTVQLRHDAIQDYQVRRKAIEEMANIEGKKKSDVLKILDDGIAQLKNQLVDDLGRELYLAGEKRELQEIQTSGWYTFFASKLIIFLVNYREIDMTPALYAFLLITVPLDLVTLPVTFVISACTGF